MLMTIFFSLLIILLTAPLRAQADEHLHAQGEIQGAYWEDKEGRLTIEDILAMPPASGSPAFNGLNLGFRNESFWFRVSLPPCGTNETKDRVFEIAYPLLDHIDFWFNGSKGRSPVFSTGDNRSFAERPIEHLTFGFPYTCGLYQQAIFRVQSTSAMQIPLKDWERRAYEQHLLALERPQLLYFGAILVMALYNFFIYLIVRRPPYLYYVLFALSFGFFQAGYSGLGFRYLWPDLPLMNSYVIDKSVNCIVFFAFSFTMAFMNARDLAPRIYRIGTILLGSLVLYHVISFTLPYGLAIKISIVYIVLSISLGFVITAFSIAKRQREGVFYGIAWNTFLVGTIALAFNKLGILPRNALTEHAQQISSVLEMLLLSFALADQMNVLRFNLAKSKQKLEKTLASIEQIVDEKTQSMRSIMDTLREGIITIAGQDFVIEAEYSRHTEVLLGEQQLGGRRFQDVFLNRLILGEDAKALIISALQTVMDEPSVNFQFNSFHLPQEARLETRSGIKEIVIDWTPILNHDDRVVRMLIAIHDVTELRSLKQEQATQSLMLIRLNQLLSADDMALRVFLLHARQTLDVMHESIAEVTDVKSLINRLFINFHTLKGESRSLGLTELSDHFHLMEDRLDQVRQQKAVWDATSILQELLSMESLVAEYAALYESHVGSLTEERVIAIKQGKLERWEKALQQILPHSPQEEEARRLLLNDVFQFLHVDLSTYEEKLQGWARQMARELGKSDPQLLLAGQGIYLSQHIVEKLDHVFIHILQNALVHGIESPEERRLAGKSEAGLIYIKVARVGDEVVLTARDDGRGVNVNSVRQKAVSLGILEPYEDLTEQKLEACLLQSGFSSREQVINLAGRGVGMGAVKQFVEELSGRMHLEFVPEQDGHRTFALVMTFPASLFPTLIQERSQAA
jgi:HPt (histidine-containing phosphotransfer) domain-containing protein/PAS domain-containing protein